MPGCIHIETCPFFNDRMASRPAMAEMMKKKYCQLDPDSCARLQVRKALGPGSVPTDLYPADSVLATSLIADSPRRPHP